MSKTIIPTKLARLRAFQYQDQPLLLGPTVEVPEVATMITIDADRLEWTTTNTPDIKPIKLVFIEMGPQDEDGAWLFEFSLNETVKLYADTKRKAAKPQPKVLLT